MNNFGNDKTGKMNPPVAQDFADQKKEEVKKTYSTSHADRINNAYRDSFGRNAHADEIANWTSSGMGIADIQKGLNTVYARDGEHFNSQQLADHQIQDKKNSYSTNHQNRINNAYRDTYGRNAHADEIANWTGTGMGIEDIQKGLNTIYARDGEHLSGDQLSSLQIQQPQSPPPPSQEIPETTSPQNPETLEEKKGRKMDEINNRFAGSDAFRDSLQQAKSLGPIETQQQNQVSNQQTASPQSDNGSEQNLNKGRLSAGETSSNIRTNFNSQLDNEAEMRRQSPNTQDSNDFVKKYALLNDDLQSTSGNPFDIANQAIGNARANSKVDIKALDRNIRQAPEVNRSRSELYGLQIFGDRYRNSRENPVSWSSPDKMDPVKAPDFEGYYDNAKDDINKIKI